MLYKGQKIGDWKYIGNTTEPGNPLWDEFENVKTGEKSLKEYRPKNITRFGECKHYYEILDGNGNFKCKHCPQGGRIVWGHQYIHKGKIVPKL